MINNNKNFNSIALTKSNYCPLIRKNYSESDLNNINIELRNSDIMLVLTINNTVSKEKVKSTITGKITILDNIDNINLSIMFNNLNAMKVNKLNIFSISQSNAQEGFNFSYSEHEYLYIEIGIKGFIEMLQMENFLEYNKNSLYIFRDINYYQIKNLVTKIENCSVTIGRGSSQKSHALSPLEVRLSAYIMAMLNFDNELISKLNMFNYLSKNIYLPTKKD